MAIQFRCVSCQKAIEVDEQYAGQSAACPYCQQVNVVPEASTYRPDGTPAAAAAPPPPAPEAALEADRGGMTAPPPPPPGTGQSPFTPATGMPRRGSALGTVSVVCTILMLVSFAVVFVGLGMGFYSFLIESGRAMAEDPDSFQRAMEEIQQLPAEEQQKLMAEMSDDLMANGMVVGASLATVLFALVGLLTGIASLRGSGSKWKGIVGIVVCAPFALCCGLSWLSSIFG